MEQRSIRNVTATLDGAPYTTRLEARGHAVVSDEPADHGGQDLGPSPHEMLLGGLASCTAITIRMYADRKGWPLPQVRVEARMERSQRGAEVDTRITLHIVLPDGLDEAQRARLLQIGNACPVHRTLTNKVAIEVHAGA